MHLLLIAYEYPPIESAHGLRWGYLARELARCGHSLDVISAELGLASEARFDAERIAVRREFPGPFVGGSRWLAQRRGVASDSAGRSGAASAPSLAERGYRLLRSALDQVLVPDIRSEWLPWGLRAARAAVRARRPDVVIASHEPGVDLAIGHRLAGEFDLPLMADLGDPMLASYAPGWRRRIDARFERRWLSRVDALTVTTSATRDLLRGRLPWLRHRPVEVVAQGFDPAPAAGSTDITFDAARLELLYTGTLYADFRHPQPLLDALSARPDARLTIIGSLHGLETARLHAHPQVRFLGRRSHAEVRAAQRAAGVLVNIGNRDDVQVPGKLFEYFGAGRPILHLAQTDTDPSAALVRERRRGVAVRAQSQALAQVLCAADPFPHFDPDPDAVADYAWPALAARIEVLLHDLVRARPAREHVR